MYQYKLGEGAIYLAIIYIYRMMYVPVQARRGSYIPSGEDAQHLQNHFHMVNGRRGSTRELNQVDRRHGILVDRRNGYLVDLDMDFWVDHRNGYLVDCRHGFLVDRRNEYLVDRRHRFFL